MLGWPPSLEQEEPHRPEPVLLQERSLSRRYHLVTLQLVGEHWLNGSGIFRQHSDPDGKSEGVHSKCCYWQARFAEQFSD